MKYFNTSYEYFEGTFSELKSFLECYHDFGYNTLSIATHNYGLFFWRYSCVVKKDNMISDELHEIMHYTPPHLKYPIL